MMIVLVKHSRDFISETTSNINEPYSILRFNVLAPLGHVSIKSAYTIKYKY